MTDSQTASLEERAADWDWSEVYGHLAAASAADEPGPKSGSPEPPASARDSTAGGGQRPPPAGQDRPPPDRPDADRPGSSGEDAPPPEGPGETGLAWRRELLHQGLVSEQLLLRIEVTLHRQRVRPLRWDELVEEARDVLNEVARRALDMPQLGRFNPDRAGALPWLMGIAINVIRERRGGRFSPDLFRHPTEASFSEAQWQQLLDGLSQETPPAEDSRLDNMWATFERLPAPQQEVLRLRYLDDLSWARVGERLGISRNSACVRGMRALRALRETLGL